MHLVRMSFGGVPPFTEPVTFKFDEQVNLFAGPNASGKSTILRAIESLFSEGDKNTWSTSEELEWLRELEDQLNAAEAAKEETLDEELWLDEIERLKDEISGYDYTVQVELHPSSDWPRDSSGSDRINWGKIPVLYIPATRVSLPRFKFPDVIIDTVKDPDENTPLDNVFDTRSGIFNGYYVELAIRELGGGTRLNRDQKNQLRRVLNIGYSCAKRICDEVMHDDVPHPFIEIDKDSIPERIVHPGMGIGTNDNIMGEPLHASVLSSGTQGTLLWIYALALKMASHYGWKDGWEKKPAILLIDEIENHLHPTWQRRVIPALLDHFPKLQIFATTHSPFVVAGLKAGQVHLLKRDPETGAVTAETNTKNVIGWTADEILRTMLGVPDPTDERTANAAQELRRLRKEWPRDTPEKEEERQQRMRELRELVDRDLLAGGPMARQREIFEQQFAEALRKYQESQSLNQENGPPSAQ